MVRGFKPYKGVSSNVLNPASTLILAACFKPYKGVSSNFWKKLKEPSGAEFQTL